MAPRTRDCPLRRQPAVRIDVIYLLHLIITPDVVGVLVSTKVDDVHHHVDGCNSATVSHTRCATCTPRCQLWVHICIVNVCVGSPGEHGPRRSSLFVNRIPRLDMESVSDRL